jgi:lantibiotic modifying enzyme
MPWTALLQGPLADRARVAAREVALAIADRRVASAVDRTVFFAYAAAVFDEPFAHDAYGAALDEVIAGLSKGSPHLGLFGGLTGTAWTLGHVLDDADGAVTTIDEWLARALRMERWPGSYDLVHGLSGLGVYFIERIASGAAGDAAHEGLAHVVRHLAATAIHTPHGTTWLTPAAHLRPELAREWPLGQYDCGVAHGVPGVIAALAQAAQLGDHAAEARHLCEDATRWLAHQRQPPDPDGDGRFPTSVYDGHEPDRSRAAWCYGDPGIAAALWRAAPQLAREVALEGTRRPVETCGVRDAGLCHGAAGLAHLYSRFFHASSDAAFADTARTWFERALAMRGPGGVAGFTSYCGDRPASPDEDASLLEGAIGIALALLAATTPTEPRWDRVLACNLPVSTEGGCS